MDVPLTRIASVNHVRNMRATHDARSNDVGVVWAEFPGDFNRRICQIVVIAVAAKERRENRRGRKPDYSTRPFWGRITLLLELFCRNEMLGASRYHLRRG